MRRLPVLAALAFVLATPAAHAGLLGVELDAAYYLPDTSTVYDQATFTPPTFVVGAGQETDGNVEGVTHLLVDFSDTKLTIQLNTVLGAPKWNPNTFSGPIFSLHNPGSLGIVSATVNGDTTMNGFDNSRVTFNNSQILINWENLSYVNGTKVVVDFGFVPEPSSIIALGAGCVALPLLARRRRRPAA